MRFHGGKQISGYSGGFIGSHGECFKGLRSFAIFHDITHFKDVRGYFICFSRVKYLSPIAHVRADGKLGSLPLGHLGNTLVPTGDHLQEKEINI